MNLILEQLYRTGTVQDAEGRSYKLHSGISSRHAAILYQLVRQYKPTLAIEVGMAYGLSSLTILQALCDNGGGRLISLDPYQRTDWHNIGCLNVQRAGLTAYHTLIEEPSYLALPALLRQKTVVEFAYVDGWHTFDYVLLDFFYLDKLLCTGGIIGFNDCGLRAVDRVLTFIRTHRRYDELRDPIPREYRGRHALITLIRWLLDKPRSDRYFVKRENWEPSWNFYQDF